MATGWLHGTVKEVVSGDTLVIMGPSRGGPPPEKRLTLASLIAPRMVGVFDADEVIWVCGNWHRLLDVCRQRRLDAMAPHSMSHSLGTAENFCARNVLDRYRSMQVNRLYKDDACTPSTPSQGDWRRLALSKSTTCWKTFPEESLGPFSSRERTRISRCWWCLLAGPRYSYLELLMV